MNTITRQSRTNLFQFSPSHSEIEFECQQNNKNIQQIDDFSLTESELPWEERAIESAEKKLQFLRSIQQDLNTLRFPELPTPARVRSERRIKVAELLQNFAIKKAKREDKAELRAKLATAGARLMIRNFQTPKGSTVVKLASPLGVKSALAPTQDLKTNGVHAALLLDKIKSSRLKTLQIPVNPEALKRNSSVTRALSPDAIPQVKKKKVRLRKRKTRSTQFFSSLDAVNTACNLYGVSPKYPLCAVSTKESKRVKTSTKNREVIDPNKVFKYRSMSKGRTSGAGLYNL